MNFESQFVHCDYDYDYKVWPEVYLLLINLLICLLTANYQLYKVLNHVLNHKMMKNDFDFYLEDITDSSLNTEVELKYYSEIYQNFRIFEKFLGHRVRHQK